MPEDWTVNEFKNVGFGFSFLSPDLQFDEDGSLVKGAVITVRIPSDQGPVKFPPPEAVNGVNLSVGGMPAVEYAPADPSEAAMVVDVYRTDINTLYRFTLRTGREVVEQQEFSDTFDAILESLIFTKRDGGLPVKHVPSLTSVNFEKLAFPFPSDVDWRITGCGGYNNGSCGGAHIEGYNLYSFDFERNDRQMSSALTLAPTSGKISHVETTAPRCMDISIAQVSDSDDLFLQICHVKWESYLGKDSNLVKAQVLGEVSESGEPGFMVIPHIHITAFIGKRGNPWVDKPSMTGVPFVTEYNLDFDGVSFTPDGSSNQYGSRCCYRSSIGPICAPRTTLLRAPNGINSTLDVCGEDSQEPCSASALESFLTLYSSPLAGHGGTFVAAGRQWNVDPRLIIAIAGAESSLGKNGPCATQRHNPFGWGGGWPDCWNFGSWDDAINLVTQRIRELYFDTWHLYNIHDIGQTYCGSGCANWEPNVRWFYAELGGNPDTNDLSFAACSGTPQPSLQLASNLTLNPNPPLSVGTQATFDFDIRNTGGATAELDEVFVAATTATGDNWKAWASAVDIAPGETRHFQAQAPIWPHAGTWHVREIIVYFKDRHYEVFHPNCAFSANCDFEVQVQATPVPTNTPTPTPSPTPAPQGVRVYRDTNYQGQSEYFKQNQHNLHSSGWGDVISSLKVDPGFYTTLFEHVDYLGRCQVFSSDQADLSGSWIGNDVVSSLELGTGSPPSDTGGINGQIDTIPRVVSDQLVAEGWARDANSGPCPGIYQVRLYVDGNHAGDASYGHWSEDQGCHCGWRIEHDTRQLSQGSHTFEFQFVDRSGNVFSDPAITRRTVSVDHEPPTNPTQVSETGCSAASNVWQTCRTPSFSWNGADGTGSDVAGYYVYFGGDANGFSDHFVTDTQYTPAPVDTGTYYLRVKTKDAAGNTARWKTLFVFKYDGVPPANPSFTVEQGGAPNDRWQNDVRAPMFTWSGAHDDHSGLDGFYIYFGPDPAGTANTLYRPGNSYTFDPIANAGEWAIYYLRVQARDRAGNLAPWVTLFTLRYDGAPPSGTVTINNDASQTDTVQVELTLSASDEGSGVAGMQFRNNDGNWHDWTAYATHWDWQVPSVNRTAHTVSARFRDVAGNVSAAASDDIFLEVQPLRPSSSNFILSASANGIGGDQRSSGNFWMGDTIGEPIAPQPDTPAQQSSNFRIVSGFQASFQGESAEPTPTPTPSPTPPATPVPPPTPAPSYGLTINEGAQYTHRTDVTLRLIAPWDTEQVMVSNDGGFAGATWQPYVETMEWTIDRYQDFVVDRTVYVRYPTRDGQEVQRQDNIILDPVEPVSSIRNTETLSQAAARLLGVHVTEGTVPIQVEWGADDGGGSGIRRYIVQVMDHTDGVWRDWLNQTTETSGVFEAQPGHTYSFRTRAQDQAGNWEPPGEAAYTVSVAGLVLNGCVTLERRGPQGDDRWITQLYRGSEAGIRMYKAGTTDLLGAFSATTDADGCFSVELAGMEPSTYDISVKGANTLSNKRLNISLPSDTEIDFGTLRVGDSNGDDRVNGADVSYMVPSFLKCEGNADFRPYADTNKDGCINGADVSALVPNFLQSGDDVSAMAVPPQGVQPGSGASTSILRRAQGTAELSTSLSLSPSSPSVQAGDIFTLDIVADTGTGTADTVDAYIDFDPALLEVVDASGAPATTIEPNTELFDFVTFNVANSAAGQINFSATSFGSPLTGAFTVATVRFRARTKADVTSVIFVRGGARISDLYQSGESLNVTITKWRTADSE